MARRRPRARDEVCRIRGLQEELAVRSPEDPRRVFGEAVEADASASGVGGQLARMFTTMNQRLTKQEAMLARIQERLEPDRQRVNLNVRAPKRATHYPVARSIAGVGRPFPVSKILDQKERKDPSWSVARRSFAPSFSMQVQVLKKRKLKEEGVPGIYVEQNHRPQLLYTIADRGLIEEAWELTTADREDLVGVSQASVRALPAAPSRPTVLDLLRGGT